VKSRDFLIKINHLINVSPNFNLGIQITLAGKWKTEQIKESGKEKR
jgi:hypothetical protein